MACLNEIKEAIDIISKGEDIAGDRANGVDVDIPFEYDPVIATQLGSTIYRNLTEAQLSSPRKIITGKDLANFRFRARFEKAKFGTLDNQPVCLVVLRFSFQKFGSTSSRYKHAEIDVYFEDATSASDENLSSLELEESMIHAPRIQKFQPGLYYGAVSSGLGSTQVGGSITLAAPGGVFSASPNVSRTTPFEKQGAAKIHGVLTDDDTRVKFSIDENSMSNDGIRAEWSAAMIVTYTSKRRFAVRVEIKAHIFFLDMLNPVCGKKDEPVYFDPEHMQMSWHANNGAQDQDGRLAPAVEVDVLDSSDTYLQGLTRLGIFGGTFI